MTRCSAPRDGISALSGRRRFLQTLAAVAGGALVGARGCPFAAADEPVVRPALRIPRRKKRTANIGIFGVGHYTYWGQFPGLRDDMLGKMAVLVKRVKAREVTVTDFGLIDNAQGARALLPKLQAANLDLVFCDMVTSRRAWRC